MPELPAMDALWRLALPEQDGRMTAVSIWTVALATCAGPPGVLPAHEQARAAAYLNREARDRFCAGRVLLRRVLGERLGLAPTAVPLVIAPGGKPALSPPHTGVHFSLAHAGALVVVAVADGEPVGVDVERVRPMREADAMARLAFSAEEREALLRLPEAERQQGFFAAWVRQEATFKLGRPAVTLFEWSPRPDHRAALAAAAPASVRHMPDPSV